ncbi:FHA domain-containing protein [Ruania zhangjianzhongii]|uniref:FHA domain-containing protein n=1 Tax=Ruania zhangjianzhongii TaxID=2603206 RepID=UPI0011C9ED8B|nr:FHA domain-containing protein [Ruania zhangjianzhongii]
MTVNLTARYVHGEWTALVTGHGTALLDPRIATEQVEQVWAALSEGRGVSGCLEVLAADGFANLPAFALVQHGEDELRVLVRGEVEVTAGESTVGAAGIATWREALLPGQHYRVEVTGDGATHPEWPLSGGVVLASRVEWLGSAGGASGAAGAAAVAEDGDGSGDEAGDDGDGDPEPAAEQEPAAGAEPVADEAESAPGDAGETGGDDESGETGGDDESDGDEVRDGASAEAALGIGAAVPVAAAVVGGAVTGSEAEDDHPTEDGRPEDGLPTEGNPDEDADGESVDDVFGDHQSVDDESVDDEPGDDEPGDDEVATDDGAEPAEPDEPADDFGDDTAEPADDEAGEPAAFEEPAALDEPAGGETRSDEVESDASAEADGLGDDPEEAGSGGTPDDPSDEAPAELDASAEAPDAPSEDHGDEAEHDRDGVQGSGADAPMEVSAHTAEEESAPSPAEFPGAAEDGAAEEGAAEDNYATDAPTLTSSGSDIIDSLPWAVSASDREQARAAQEQAAAEPPATPAFDEPEDQPAQLSEAGQPAAGADDELPEQTVLSRAGAEAPDIPAAPAPAPEPAAASADSDVISFDSLMAQQVPQAPSPGYAHQAGAEYGAPPPAEQVDQPYPAAAPPYGPGAAFGAPGVQQAAPPPWAPPADMSQPAPTAQGQGDVDIEGDHDGETIMVSQLPSGNGAAPGTGESDLYDEPHAAAQPSIHLAMSTGAHVPLDRPVLIGRAPESARFNAGVQPRLVTVASPEQDISRTHVEIRAEGGHAVVTDLNSTNGTVVVQPGSPPRRLHPGEGASVPAGTVVDLGDGVTLTVQTTSQGAG